MAIGAIIGSIISGPTRSKFGPKGSMIYMTILNIIGVAANYASYSMFEYPDFKNDENYESSLQKVYDQRSETDQAAEMRVNDGKPYNFTQWRAVPGNEGYSHVGFEHDFPVNLYYFAIGRLLNGVFVGVASAICPNYIIEISPVEMQGAIGACNQLLITVGILAMNIFGLEEVARDNSTMTILIPGIISVLFAGVLLSGILPESPKFTFESDQGQAKVDLTLFRADLSDVNREISAMEKEKEAAKNSPQNIGVMQMFSYQAVRWQVITIIYMHIAQPMSGVNAVLGRDI